MLTSQNLSMKKIHGILPERELNQDALVKKIDKMKKRFTRVHKKILTIISQNYPNNFVNSDLKKDLHTFYHVSDFHFSNISLGEQTTIKKENGTNNGIN